MVILERIQMDMRVHGGRGFGRHYLEAERILKFAIAHNLVVHFSRKGRVIW